MAVKRIVHRTGFIGGAISDASTILPIDDQLFLDIIAASIDFSMGEYFYMTIEEDDLLEEVKVTGATPTYLVISRAQGPTDASPFTMAASYNTDLTAAEVNERAAGLAPVAPVTIAPTGLVTATETSPGAWEVGVIPPVFSGQNGIEVAGSWPNYTIGMDMSTGCCGGDDVPGGGGVPYLFVGGGITEVTVDGTEVTINTPAPNFTGEGISITGAWPNLVFAVEGVAGGTVTVVGVGAGLSLTGNPNINPTIAMSATGVAPGTYGGMTFNNRGQLTAIDPAFDPVSAITEDSPALSITRTGGSVVLHTVAAAEGIVGVVALADADSPLDTSDATTAVTPKLLGAVIADLASTQEYGNTSYGAETTSDYTNTVAAASVTLALLSGDKAIVFVEITAKDAADTDPVEFGVAVFNATPNTLRAGNRKMKQSQQTLMFVVDGPFTDTLQVKTTALAAGESIVSQSVHALVL